MIHEIVFHGKGGYDWGTVYNMPIWLRKFTFQSIQEYYQQVNQQQSKKAKTKPQLSRPDISPSYSTKGSTK